MHHSSNDNRVFDSNFDNEPQTRNRKRKQSPPATSAAFFSTYLLVLLFGYGRGVVINSRGRCEREINPIQDYDNENIELTDVSTRAHTLRTVNDNRAPLLDVAAVHDQRRSAIQKRFHPNSNFAPHSKILHCDAPQTNDGRVIIVRRTVCHRQPRPVNGYGVCG